jgi:hypothetical protein
MQPKATAYCMSARLGLPEDRQQLPLWYANAVGPLHITRNSKRTFAHVPLVPSKCPAGLPAQGANGREIFCGLGPQSRPCPTNYTCVIDPADRFAVCCKATPNERMLRMNARFKSFAGQEPAQLVSVETPSQSPKAQSKPGWFTLRTLAVVHCTPRSSKRTPACVPLVPSKCATGQPAQDANGRELFCGRGPQSRPCPANYTCVIDPADRFAVCCKATPNERMLCINVSY